MMAARKVPKQSVISKDILRRWKEGKTLKSNVEGDDFVTTEVAV
jgi:hypothetical protein